MTMRASSSPVRDRAITQLLDNLIRQPVDQGTLPHMYAAVARDGEVVYEGEAGDTARDRIYRIMSMTKPVTSVACMQLVEQGQISLDAPVTDYLEIAGPRGVSTFSDSL